MQLVDKDGVIVKLKQCGNGYAVLKDSNDFRSERYLLQNKAAEFLRPFKNPRGGYWRVTKCLRTCVASDVVVLRSPEVESCYYGNLMVCGSVWTCPICASKITQRRRLQLESILNLHSSVNGLMVMVTLTFSHTKNDNLVKLLGRGDQSTGLRRALNLFRNTRIYRRLLKSIGYVGLIRALEVTYSDRNGWHPHTHELFLLDGSVSIPEVIKLLKSSSLFRVWLSSCRKAGLGLPNKTYGINVVPAFDPSNYLQKFGYEQKWGVSNELTKQHLKKGRFKSLSPFDFLRLADENYKKYRTLFNEYANAFFGARQLFFSRGLLNLFNVENLSDEELAQDNFEDSSVLVRITKEEWAKILALPYDLRSDILREAEQGNYDFYSNFIKV